MNEIFIWIAGRMILTGQPKVPGERAVSMPLCYHKSHMDRRGIKPGPPR